MWTEVSSTTQARVPETGREYDFSETARGAGSESQGTNAPYRGQVSSRAQETACTLEAYGDVVAQLVKKKLSRRAFSPFC